MTRRLKGNIPSYLNAKTKILQEKLKKTQSGRTIKGNPLKIIEVRLSEDNFRKNTRSSEGGYCNSDARNV